MPAAYALYAEFLPREKRAEHLAWLCISWVVGGVYAAAMAWAVIPNTGWGCSYGSNYEVNSLNHGATKRKESVVFLVYSIYKIL